MKGNFVSFDGFVDADDVRVERRGGTVSRIFFIPMVASDGQYLTTNLGCVAYGKVADRILESDCADLRFSGCLIPDKDGSCHVKVDSVEPMPEFNLTEDGIKLLRRNGGVIKEQVTESNETDYSEYDSWDEVFDVWADEVGGWDYYKGLPKDSYDYEEGVEEFYTAEESRDKLEEEFKKAMYETTIRECIEEHDKFGTGCRFGYIEPNRGRFIASLEGKVELPENFPPYRFNLCLDVGGKELKLLCQTPETEGGHGHVLEDLCQGEVVKIKGLVLHDLLGSGRLCVEAGHIEHVRSHDSSVGAAGRERGVDSFER